jgi:hypothetical protein
MIDWHPLFLKALASSPNVARAARLAGIARRSAYDAREADPEFALAWDDALNTATDALVGEAWRRAKDGVQEPVIYKGELMGEWMLDGLPCFGGFVEGKYLHPSQQGATFVPLVIHKPSDALAMFLLKAHRPEVYREVVEQKSTGGVAVAVTVALDAALMKVYGDLGNPESTGDPA